MMRMLLEIQNFEPNTEARDLLERFYVEDVSTLLALHNQGRQHLASAFDNIGMFFTILNWLLF